MRVAEVQSWRCSEKAITGADVQPGSCIWRPDDSHIPAIAVYFIIRIIGDKAIPFLAHRAIDLPFPIDPVPQPEIG